MASLMASLMASAYPASRAAMETPNFTAASESTGLLRLSNELIEQMISNAYHWDLVHLALTCHLVHELAKPALRQHRVLMDTMNILTVEDNA